MVLLIVISGLGSFIYAQNNPYKIKDSLYELYELGFNNISNKLDSFVQGTGLGLNICRIIADQMHGTVKVDTTYTAGARLVFSIPL